MNFRNTLKALQIIQIVSNEERHKKGLKKLGRGYLEAIRINPYNPLSYIFVIIIFIGGILTYGFLGFCDQMGKNKNPFKWE